jgi:glyoxylase-like metal-dependent hydrolase (beta-lactamase superfamily II)
MDKSDLLHGTARITDLDEAWSQSRHGTRYRAVRRAGESLRERFASGPRCLAVRTLPLTSAPYPTKYAFRGAASSPVPLVSFTHRCLLVQFFQRGALKNLLFNPTDIEAARETPYFAALKASFGRFTFLEKVVQKKYDPLETQLEALGLRPEDIDYIAFDHFHTQDLRGQLGTTDGQRRPRFPNATLLAPKVEWDDWDDLHPMQRTWFIADGREGVRLERVALTTGDLQLGDGVMLLRTPGHTSGNQTLFISTDTGVWGTSENGTCADCWSPIDSKIPGVARAARLENLDVLINDNTPEAGADQHTSMVLERTIVDRVKDRPAFCQMFPSTEITPSAMAPGLAPTLLHRAITHGSIAPRASKRAERTGTPANVHA